MIKSILILCFALFNLHLFGTSPITPDKVLTHEEIAKIHAKNDYFYLDKMDDVSPIWEHTSFKYGSHLLGRRTSFVNLKMAVHNILNEGFPIRRRLAELYRARLGIHSQIGNVLPQLKISFASNLGGLFTEAFSGLLGFLSPANWLAIPNQTHIYNVTKNLLVKDVMDEMLKAKIAYITQHQLITDFEILNFYFIHLQILADKFNEHNRPLDLLRAEFSMQGTDMASKRGDVILGFDDLALTIALERLGDRYSVDNLNIVPLHDFPKVVKDLKDLPTMYRDKEEFLHSVVARSIELKIIEELLKVSKLNIGIAAFGGLIDDRSSVVGKNNAAMAIRFGYNSLPNLLISESFAHTAQIDVRSNYLSMLDNARRSFDHYTIALEAFAEAKRSVERSRHAFKENLRYLIDNKTIPDPPFIVSMRQLIYSELKLNNALHYSLLARARMDRYLLVDDLGALEYVPEKKDIDKYFDEILRLPYAEQSAKEKDLDNFFAKVKSSHKLTNLLYQKQNDFATFSPEEINAGLMRNMDRLLFKNFLHRKNKKFYRALHDYIETQPTLLMPSTLREKFHYPAHLNLPRSHF